MIACGCGCMALPAMASDYVYTESVTVDDNTISLSWDCGTTLTNNDTSTSWWDGGTDAISLTGDFQPKNVIRNFCLWSPMKVLYYQSDMNAIF